jgi:hypothetical protein
MYDKPAAEQSKLQNMKNGGRLFSVNNALDTITN